jgi:cell wall-associated NlpC family hydrolase
MLSFIISNAILVSQALTGMTPAAVESREISNYVNQANAQSLVVTAEAAQNATRDDITVNVAPRTQSALTRSQIVVQSLPASNSALVNSAIKYLGYNWDCTALVEQALRDLGYQVPDLGPMQFGQFGTVFYDPSQVQAGDIMMRGGHVAIYAGDGYTVQGGFGFGGVVYNQWENPYHYAAFVRIG